MYKTLHSADCHFGWDNGIPPAVRVAPGEALEIGTRDASDGQVHPAMNARGLLAYDTARANPVTGPIAVDGAEPGDALHVTIEAIEPNSHAWTGVLPNFGLLADQFTEPALIHSAYLGESVAFGSLARLPARPMIGTLGVAPAEAGRHPIIPPRRTGGNMDIPDLTAGTTVVLPVAVSGALLSIGDAHSGQGDGEVCGTGLETAATVRLKIALEKAAAPRFPRLLTARQVPSGGDQGAACWIGTGIGPDLLVAARDAVSEAIDMISGDTGMAPQDTYMLISVAGSLRIAQLVDMPNWTVTCRLPGSVFA